MLRRKAFWLAMDIVLESGRAAAWLGIAGAVAWFFLWLPE